jgi:hypothetical protein
MCPCTSIAKASVKKQQENQPFLHFTFLVRALARTKSCSCARGGRPALSLSLSLSLSPEQDSPGIVCRVAICHLVLNNS